MVILALRMCQVETYYPLNFSFILALFLVTKILHACSTVEDSKKTPHASSPSPSESDVSLPLEADTLSPAPAALPPGTESLPLGLDPPAIAHLQVCTSISQFSLFVYLHTLILYVLSVTGGGFLVFY